MAGSGSPWDCNYTGSRRLSLTQHETLLPRASLSPPNNEFCHLSSFIPGGIQFFYSTSAPAGELTALDDMAATSGEAEPLINDNPELQSYYQSLESRVGHGWFWVARAILGVGMYVCLYHFDIMADG